MTEGGLHQDWEEAVEKDRQWISIDWEENRIRMSKDWEDAFGDGPR